MRWGRSLGVLPLLFSTIQLFSTTSAFCPPPAAAAARASLARLGSRGRMQSSRRTAIAMQQPEEPAGDVVSNLFSRLLFPGGSRKQIFFGVLQRAIDPAAIPSEEERARRRGQAAADLVNIDDAERERRRLAGTALGCVTAVFAIWLLASHAGALARLAIAPPLFVSYGYLQSAEQGL